MSTTPNPRDLHRATLVTCLRVLGQAKDLAQARSLLGHMLNGYQKAIAEGLTKDRAMERAEARLPIPQPRPAPRPADRAPIRRRTPAPS
jgi:hypothetical protein